jgi:hypothetical protein
MPARFWASRCDIPGMTYSLGLVNTDRGYRIALGRTVPVPARTVWAVFTTVSLWAEWGPPVTGVDYPDPTISEGTGGRVQAFGLFWIPFRIEAVADMAWTWSVWGQTPPADGHRVESLGPTTSRAVLELPLWAPWYLPLCLVALRTVARVARREQGDSRT